MTKVAIALDEAGPVLAEFGQRHPVISKLEVFGSVADGSATAESDLDVLVTFADEVPRDSLLYGKHVSLIEELGAIFGRKVDLVDRRALRDDVFGYNVLLNSKTVYERL